MSDNEKLYATLVVDGIEQESKGFNRVSKSSEYVMIDWLRDIAKDCGAESNEATFIKITNLDNEVLSKYTIDGLDLY